MNNDVYYDRQKDLYSRERVIIRNIRKLMADRRMQGKLLFHLFFFNLICRFRYKTMERLLNNYVAAGLDSL